MQQSGYPSAGPGGPPGGYGEGGWPGGPYGYQPRPRRFLPRLLAHLVVAILAAALGAGLVLAFNSPSGTRSAASAPGGNAVPAPAASPGGSSTPAGSSSTPAGSEQAVVNKVEPGLVVIDTRLRYSSEAGAATGMVINSNGLVLTNNHVIEGSTKITVTVVATGKTYPAKVIGYDKTGDVGLIQVQGAPALKTVPIGNSASVKVGDPVVAMGNADGHGAIVPAAGRITGLNQTITAADQAGPNTTETLHGMLVTNAAIVSGDSGGPLANSAGQVIGMDTAGNSVSFAQQTPTAGFAIPINTALSVARQIAAGHASANVTIGYPPFLGVFTASGSASSPQAQAQAQAQQNPFGSFGGAAPPQCYTSNANLVVPTAIAPVSSGTLVDGPICGSPAASAGLVAGSVITAVNGKAVGSPDSLVQALSGYRPGQTISVTWTSPSGHQSTSSIHLAAGPPQ